MLNRASLAMRVTVATVVLMASSEVLAQGPGSPPFANGYRRPAVSAYQQLGNFANNPQAASTLYQSLVQPILGFQQTQIEQISQGRRIGALQDKIDNPATPANQLTDQTIRPTGHSATFLNYSHYYPSGR